MLRSGPAILPEIGVIFSRQVARFFNFGVTNSSEVFSSAARRLWLADRVGHICSVDQFKKQTRTLSGDWSTHIGDAVKVKFVRLRNMQQLCY